MARTSPTKLAVLGLSAYLCSRAFAQQSQGPTVILTASPSATSGPPSTITPATTLTPSSATTSNDVPLSLWGVADSLLSSYYPSTSLTQVATLTWPTAVVLGSSTISVHADSTGSPTTSVLAEQTASSNNSGDAHKPLSSDAKLGIGIGVAVGAVALLVLALVLGCLHRRKKRTGAFFKRRATPSITDSEVGTWRSPMAQRQTSVMSNMRPNNWAQRYEPMPDAQASVLQPPPMAMHPAYARQYSNYSSSEDNPFYTPEERSQHHEMDGAGVPAYDSHDELHDESAEPRHSWESIQQEEENRPPTPFSPMMMMMGGGKGHRQSYERSNPFSSPEDGEADDVVSPIVPTRSPERRHSPMIHYPSWGEVSEFDFSSEGRGRSVRGQSSLEDSSGDEWRPRRESVIGRYELA